MSPIIEGSERQGTRLYMGKDKFAVSEYDFSIDGGAVSSIPLRGDKVPALAIVTQSIIQVDTIVAGGAASIGVTVETAGDLQSVALISGTPWSTTGPKWASNGAHGGGATQPIQTTVIRTPTAVISGAPLTAGKFRIIVEYIEL